MVVLLMMVMLMVSFDDDDDDDVGIASIVDNRHVCNVNYLTTVIMQPLCIYTLLIGHYGSVINDGNVDGNKISESDENYDYHTFTNDTLDDHDDGYTMVFRYYNIQEYAEGVYSYHWFCLSIDLSVLLYFKVF